ncbi:hypothetical protein OG21DRAFT_1500909 [Imleria badia]|nr:hypothetical protein OG21DRAFT_1500909 [Imleria badia]
MVTFKPQGQISLRHLLRRARGYKSPPKLLFFPQSFISSSSVHSSLSTPVALYNSFTMRVLSFIPAFLLAAASFVVAAPASTPVDAAVSYPTGTGNDAALQPVITIIANTTDHVQGLNVQLTNLKGDSCTPDAVSAIVVQINAVVSTCVTQLQATAKVDLTGLDLTNLYVAIYGLLGLILTVLNTLVTIVLFLGVAAVGKVQTAASTLLNTIIVLAGCLNIFVDVSASATLGPVIIVVKASVDLILSIVIKLNVFLGAN